MAVNDGYRRYVEAAAALGQITRARAEEMLREVASGGDASRARTQEWVDDMVDRSRKATEGLVEMVRAEVSSQMEALGVDPEKLARQAADLLRRSAEAGRRVMQDVTQSGTAGTAPTTSARGATAQPARSATTTSAREASATTSGGKRAPAKKSPGRAVVGKKAPGRTVTKAPGRAVTKSPGTTVTGTKAPATKAPVKKVPVKKVTAKKAAGPARAAAKKRGSGSTP